MERLKICFSGMERVHDHGKDPLNLLEWCALFGAAFIKMPEHTFGRAAGTLVLDERRRGRRMAKRRGAIVAVDDT